MGRISPGETTAAAAAAAAAAEEAKGASDCFLASIFEAGMTPFLGEPAPSLEEGEEEEEEEEEEEAERGRQL